MSAAREGSAGGGGPRAAAPGGALRRHRGLLAVLALLGLLGVLWGAGLHDGHFRDADAYDYAHMGRELARGHGFSTLQVFPRHLVHLEELGLLEREAWPNLYRYPLPVVAQALLGSVVPDPVRAAVLRSGLFFLLALALTARLVGRGAGPWVALAAVLFLASDSDLWTDSYGGMVESQAMALLVGLALVLAGGFRRWSAHLGLGLLAGALVLTKNQYTPVLVLAPALAWLRLEPGARARGLGLVVLGLALSAGPWLVRNASLTGDPFFSFSATRNLVLGTAATGADIEMSLDEPCDTGAILELHGNGIRRKFLAGLNRAGRGELVTGSRLYSFLALALTLGLFLPARLRAGPPARACSLLGLGMVVLGIVAVSLSFPAERFLYPVRPLLLAGTILALGGVLSGARGRGLLAVALALAALPTASSLARDGAPWAERAPDAVAREGNDPDAVLAALAREVQPGALVASDVSYRVALLADRRSLRLPEEPADLFRASDRLRRIDYVYLSSAVPASAKRVRPSKGGFVRYKHYAAFVQTEAFRARYGLLRVFGDGSRLYGLEAR